jgi:hypothetical protein
LYFLTAMLATFTPLADAADRPHSAAGQTMFWALLALFTAWVTTPLVLLLRLPKALRAPVDNSAAPSLAGALPGLQGIGHLLAHSIANGSATAFLTLRIGLVAKACCTPLMAPCSQPPGFSKGRPGKRKPKETIWHSARQRSLASVRN